MSKITYDDKQFLLLEFEQRLSEKFTVALLRFVDGQQPSSKNILILLTDLAGYKGIWSSITNSTIKVSTIKHTWPTHQQYAAILKQKIISG